MVKQTKVGKARPFIRGLLLTAITFGIYGLYWNFKAHHEVFRQFDLEDEGRDEGIIWFILGIILFRPLLWVYQAKLVGNVAYVRQRMALPPAISVARFLTLVIVGGLALFAGLVALQVLFVLNAADTPLDEVPEAERDEAAADQMRALAAGLLWLGGGLVVWGVLQGIAYHGLQRDINDVWNSFDRRMHELTVPPTPPSAAPASFAAGAMKQGSAGYPPSEPPRRP